MGLQGAPARLACVNASLTLLPYVPSRLQEFAEYVRAGTDTGRLAADDMCVLASIGCR